MSDKHSYTPAFFIVPYRIYKLPGITMAFLSIYQTIFEFWNNGKDCYLSNGAILERTGVASEGTLREAFIFFEKHGELERKKIGKRRYLIQPQRKIEIEPVDNSDDDRSKNSQPVAKSTDDRRKIDGMTVAKSTHKNNKLNVININKTYNPVDKAPSTHASVESQTTYSESESNRIWNAMTLEEKDEWRKKTFGNVYMGTRFD